MFKRIYSALYELLLLLYSTSSNVYAYYCCAVPAFYGFCAVISLS